MWPSSSTDTSSPIEAKRQSPIVRNKAENSDKALAGNTKSLQGKAAAPEEEEKKGNKAAEIIEMLQRRSLLIIGIAVVMIGNSAIKLSKVPTTYTGNFQLLVEPVNSELTALSNPGSSSSGQLDYPTQLAILRSPALLLPVVEDLQEAYPGFNIGTILQGLNIRQVGLTKIIQVSYESVNQAQTIAVLDSLSDNYVEYSRERRQTFLQQGLRFVDDQRRITQEKVDELQSQLQEFRQTNGFARPEDRSNQLTEQLGQLAAERLVVQQELASLEARLRTIQTEVGLQSLLLESLAYQAILEQIRAVDIEISLEQSRFTEENNTIQALRQRRSNLLPLLEQQASAVLEDELAKGAVQAQAYRTRLENIENARINISNDIQNLTVLIREYNNIERQLGIAINSLTGFLQTRQALQIEAAQSEIPWELVREPSSFAQGNDFAKALRTEIIKGIALGIAVAFILDKLTGSFHTLSALQTKIDLPILGVLPFNQQVFLSQENSPRAKQRKRKIFNRIKQAMFRLTQRFSRGTNKLAIALFEEYDGTVEFFESLRVIYTNIQQATGSKSGKTFVVTSADVGDGKTTVAINLADTAAAMGKKVLLVDANFRKPEVHEFLNIKNEIGLNTIVGNSRTSSQSLADIQQRMISLINDGEHGSSDDDDKQQSLFQRVFPDRDLYVLSAGPVQAASSVVLSKERLSTVIDQVKDEFDLIVFDVPSILSLADSVIFSSCTDALIMVASLHKTSQRRLTETIKELDQRDMPPLGLIVNRQKGAEPVLRATISQSQYIDYFPDLDDVNPATPTASAILDQPQAEESIPEESRSA